ncbi:MAG: hypothetical protein JWM06_1498 [Actinomycetia bacterium]|jgi:hypothetical protein|nr:hypothetical protein [Actinomycetes bacterium]
MYQSETTLFREVNQSMNDLLVQFKAEEPAEFFCECPVRDCMRRVSLTRSEYGWVRRTGGFLVSPECLPWPHVLLRSSRYVVVEDFGRDSRPVTEAGREGSPWEPAGAGPERSASVTNRSWAVA